MPGAAKTAAPENTLPEAAEPEALPAQPAGEGTLEDAPGAGQAANKSNAAMQSNDQLPMPIWPVACVVGAVCALFMLWTMKRKHRKN